MLVAFVFSSTDCGYQPDVEPMCHWGVRRWPSLGCRSVDSDSDGFGTTTTLASSNGMHHNANPTEACQYLDAFGVCGGTGLLPELLIGS